MSAAMPPGDTLPALRVAGVLGGGLAAAVLVFSLGVMVGRRATISALEAAGPPAGEWGGSPATAPLPEPAPVPPERLTFYDRLSGRAAPPPVDLPTGTAPAPYGAAAAPYAARAVEAPEPPRAPVIPPSPPAPAAPAAASDPVEQVRRLAAGGGWTVQVAALSQRAAADEFVASWRRRGLEVAATAVTSRGRTLHRIRVGSFPSRDAAGRAAEILRRDLGLRDSSPVAR